MADAPTPAVPLQGSPGAQVSFPLGRSIKDCQVPLAAESCPSCADYDVRARILDGVEPSRQRVRIDSASEYSGLTTGMREGYHWAG